MSMDKMIDVLRSNGIQMEVGGCGCCGSPWVTFAYKGQKIFDGDNCDFDTGPIEPKDVKPSPAELALRELVRLKGMKDRWQTYTQAEKDRAWEAARNALKGPQGE